MMEKNGCQGRAIMSMRKFWRKKKSVQANLKFACHEYKDLQSENHCLALQMLIFTTAELQIRQNGGLRKIANSAEWGFYPLVGTYFMYVRPPRDHPKPFEYAAAGGHT
jgi:hypothetical protein